MRRLKGNRRSSHAIPADAPPPPKPGRCRSFHTLNGDWCNRPTYGPGIYCHWCAKRKQLVDYGLDQAADDIVRLRHMTKFYSRVLRGTLADAVEEFLAQDKSAQVGLLEELALTRVEVARAVDGYQQALELKDATEPGTKHHAEACELLEQQAHVMLSRIGEVRDTVTAIARVEQSTKGMVSPLSLQVFVNQLVRIAHDHLEQDAAEELERHVREDLRMLNLGMEHQPVEFTPADSAAAMDESVPSSPE